MGYTTGEVFDGHGGDYWVKKERGQQLAVYAGLLMWPIAVVPRDRIAAQPATSYLEILRQAQISNPSYLTPEHREAIASMVERWPSFS